MNGIFQRLRPPSGALSAFLFGAAHAFDMGATLAHHRGRYGQGPQGDLLAMQGDWERAVNGAWREYGQAPE